MSEASDGDRMQRAPVRRLFFALWPDPMVRACLASVARDCVPAGAGRPQRPDQWHVTLEFLGDVPQPALREVRAAAATAAAEAFTCELAFDRLEHWQRPRVLCLASGTTPPPLAALVDTLRTALRQRGFTPESRPFRPHVTIARDARRGPAFTGIEPLRWPVRSFSLVESLGGPGGSRYVDLASWPAGADPASADRLTP